MQSLLIGFINQLPEYHYLNIIAFNDDHFKLFGKPKEANAITKMKALKFVKNLVAEGGTNMMPPVYEAILEKTDFPMKHQIILVTDGDIGFEEEMMIGEDIAFSFKMSVYHKVYFLPTVVAQYNKHPESTLSKYKNDNPKLNYYYNFV